MNATTGTTILSFPQFSTLDRRATTRFPIQEQVTYKFRRGKVAGGGSGHSLNIGSGGVLFATKEPPPLGHTIELAMNWPALLNDTCPLKFIASGPVIRHDDGQVVMRIDRYEFRTRAARADLAASIEKLQVVAPPAISPRLLRNPSHIEQPRAHR